MEQIFERFSATELDNVLHAIYKYESGDGFSADDIQTSIWLEDKIAPPIDDAIRAIINYKGELVTVTKLGKLGKRYQPGPFLETFLSYGGFKGLYDKQAENEDRNTQQRNAAHQANLATIDAAVFAKRSANASEISAGAAERSASLSKQAIIISIITLLLSLAAFMKSFLN